jgi:hypothetical protein
LIVSHVRLSVQVDLVRARSVLITPGAARWFTQLATSSWPAAYGSFVFTSVVDEGTGRVAGAFVFAVILVDYRRDIWGSQ